MDLITIAHASGNPQNKIASCAKLVCELAEKGEPNAEKIIDSAAEALFFQTNLAIAESKSPAPYKIALAGGVLKEPSLVNKKFGESKASGYSVSISVSGNPSGDPCGAICH